MNFTRTKIICTIGPATEKLSALRKLHSNGMNVARINMSHATHKSAKLIIDRIKKINSETKNVNGKIGVLLDTQGPEIRTGDTELPLELKVGEEVTLIYFKNGRYATLEMKPRRTVGGFIAGDVGSDIVISVVHPDAISDQNPYDDLNYSNLPEIP